MTKVVNATLVSSQPVERDRDTLYRQAVAELSSRAEARALGCR